MRNDVTVCTLANEIGRYSVYVHSSHVCPHDPTSRRPLCACTPSATVFTCIAGDPCHRPPDVGGGLGLDDAGCVEWQGPGNYGQPDPSIPDYGHHTLKFRGLGRDRTTLHLVSQ